MLTFLDLVNGDYEMKDYIVNELVSSAIRFYQSTLKVLPFGKNLTVPGECGGVEAPAFLTEVGYPADFILLVQNEADTESNYFTYAEPCGLSNYNRRYTIYICFYLIVLDQFMACFLLILKS